MKRFKALEQFRMLLYYMAHRIRSKHRRGHGIHSPYMYELVRNVIFDKTYHTEYNFFNRIRKELINSDLQITVREIGAGSKRMHDTRRICDMIKNSSVKASVGKLLFRLVRYYKPHTLIEFGTSVGFSTIHLSLGHSTTKIVTLEGNHSLTDFAEKLFTKHNLSNITIVEGMFDDNLEKILKDYPCSEFVFIDGNHNYESTLKYFNIFSQNMKEGFLIFDDIYWSAGMRQAWKEIVSKSSDYVTLDLFYLGIIVRKKSITPGNYYINFHNH